MPLAVLPPQIWTQILDNCYSEQALPELWVSQRHTCRIFREIIEKVFQERALPKTSIAFRSTSTNGGEVDFEFSHISEDGAVAHFERHGPLKDQEANELDRNTLESAWSTYLGRDWEGSEGGNMEPEKDKNDRPKINGIQKFRARNIFDPSHIISIHRDVNDSPIPSLVFAFDNFTMTCDWRGLLTRFYGEEFRYQNYLERWVEDKKKTMDILKGRMDKGEIDMNIVLQEALGMFAGGDKEAWRAARKARMKKQLVDTGEEWDEYFFWQSKTQENALNRLAKNRQVASLGADSDFDGDEPQSGSEDDDDDDDDEEESGEWDDVSSDDEDELAGEADDQNL